MGRVLVRPRRGTIAEHRISSPLLDAGLSKAEIRELFRETALSTWDRQASACLSLRVPYKAGSLVMAYTVHSDTRPLSPHTFVAVGSKT
jgi:PP-loop superfamily ATP-utilizing enzyme